MIHWLVNTVEPKALNAAVYTLSGGLTTTLILMPFRRALRKFWRAVDSLDPETDSGITKQLEELQEHAQEEQQERAHGQVHPHRYGR